MAPANLASRGQRRYCCYGYKLTHLTLETLLEERCTGIAREHVAARLESAVGHAVASSTLHGRGRLGRTNGGHWGTGHRSTNKKTWSREAANCAGVMIDSFD